MRLGLVRLDKARLSYQVAVDVDVTKGERQFSCVMRDVEGAVTQIETHLCQDGGWNVAHNWIFLKKQTMTNYFNNLTYNLTNSRQIKQHNYLNNI